MFSSLVGLQFMWQLMPKTSGSRHHLTHVPLKDSPLSDYGDLDIQIQLEEKVILWYSSAMSCHVILYYVEAYSVICAAGCIF